jgi:CrcB protein
MVSPGGTYSVATLAGAGCSNLDTFIPAVDMAVAGNPPLARSYRGNSSCEINWIAMTWLCIALGGALGASARHLITLATLRWYGEVVPLAVAFINLVGCFGIGLAAGAIGTGQWAPSEPVRLFVFAGILGGFTTFSSFGLDTFLLIREGRVVLAAVNAVAQLVLGVLAVFAGHYILNTRG